MRKAAKRIMSEDEIRQQKISFIYGSLDRDNNMTKQDIANVINGPMGMNPKQYG
jgi:hypothetical protein